MWIHEGPSLTVKYNIWTLLVSCYTHYVYFIDVFVVTGSFRVSLMIELECPQELGNMPWHFYDKLTYFKLKSLVGICLHRVLPWHHFLCQHCNVEESDVTSYFLFLCSELRLFLVYVVKPWLDICIFALWVQLTAVFFGKCSNLGSFSKRIPCFYLLFCCLYK